MRDKLEEIWDRITDPYWRLDHPEVTMVILSLLSGAIGLVFAYLQHKLIPGGSDDR